MFRLLLPATLLIASTGCIFYKDRDEGHDEWEDEDCWEDECWGEDEEDGRRPGERPDDDRPDGEEGDDGEGGDDTVTPSEFGVYLTPGAGPQNSTFIASLFAEEGSDLEDIAWIDFVSRDTKAILPAIVAQQARSPWERVIAVNVPIDATLGPIDAYITFTDDDYIVIERIFEVIPEGEAIPPWTPPEEREDTAEPLDTDL